ncbi:MAG: hypothetical protein LAN84_07435 [Acidobacteriia bacterium]|nr:hypothetical protein [Terriglobia bacterium]
MLNGLRFYWTAARGYRLRPWRSPYLRWRLETFLGAQAADLDARKFFRLLWRYRAPLRSFLHWAAERQRAQRRPRPA